MARSTSLRVRAFTPPIMQFKNFSRRSFVKNVLLLGGALHLPHSVFSLTPALDALSASDDLSPALLPLPLGSVQPHHWLLHQLRMQAHGITGRMEEHSDYGPDSAWRGGNGEAWERGPYYLRGLVALAYALPSKKLQARAQKWIDWSVDHQQPDGFFGPRQNRDWWARMPMLMAIRDYHEATGKKDPRILPFFEKYFRHQLAELPQRPLRSWAHARGADNIDSVLWLYREQRAQGIAKEKLSWLLELAELIRRQTQPWTDDFTATTARFHIVNTTQALKYPPLLHRLTGDITDREAFAKGIFNLSIDHGRVDQLPNADEAARDNQSIRGTESCAVVEALLSTEIALRELGDAPLGDYLEHVAYNALPITTSPDFSGHCYYALQNQVMATLGHHDFDCDHGDDCAFGAPIGFDCCFANHHMGWGKFIQHMWMGTPDGGLALIAYGPNTMRATVADGKTAAFRQETGYPFREEITLTYEGETATFPLRLRIPEWAYEASVSSGGRALSGVTPGQFFTLQRTFHPGEKITIRFPSRFATSRWYNDSLAVQRGPLLFALHVAEDWRPGDPTGLRELQISPRPEQPVLEVYPASRWNYGLLVDEKKPSASFSVEQRDIPLQPFSTATAPIVLRARGQVIPSWSLDGNKAGPQPLGPVPPDASKQAPVELLPYGCGRLKIAHFPRIGDPADFMTRERHSARERRIGNQQVLEFANVIVSRASNHTLRVTAKRSGRVELQINGQNFGPLQLRSGDTDITALREKIARPALQFKEGQYNNVRFIGADSAHIQRITVVPAEEISSPEILRIDGGPAFAQLYTNLRRTDATLRIRYGTTARKLSRTASGFSSDAICITGLQPNTRYFFTLEALLRGQWQRSAPLSFTTPPEEKAAPNTTSFAESFATPNTASRNWRIYSSPSTIQFAEEKLSFAAHPDTKALASQPSWRDGVCETVLRLADARGDAGLLLRATRPGVGANVFDGLYFGISAQGNITIGESRQDWRQIHTIRQTISPQRDYRLTVAAQGNRLAFYLDGKRVHTLWYADHPAGQSGLRAYQQSVDFLRFTTRPLTDAEQADLSTIPEPVAPVVSAVSAFESFQVKFSRVTAATHCKIVYGTTSGVYSEEIYDAVWNPFQGGVPFTADKFAVGGLVNGQTYFLRVIPVSGHVELPASEEISIIAGQISPSDRSPLTKLLGQNSSSTQQTPEAKEATNFARQLLARPQVNRMELALAAQNLRIARAENPSEP